jgi:hypothetical protein
LALAAVVILSSLVAGLATLSMQHGALSVRASAHAAALDIAEQAAMWELNKLSRSAAGESVTIDPPSSPYTADSANAYTTVGSVPDNPSGSFTVFTATDPKTTTWMSAGSLSAWSPPNDFLIRASGTVAGDSSASNVTRVVQATGFAVGPEGLYNLYGVNRLQIDGAAITAAGGTTRLQFGTAGTMQANAGGRTILDSLKGTATIHLDRWNGTQAAWSGTAAGDVLNTRWNCPLPTVQDIAEKTLTTRGIAIVGTAVGTLSSVNNNLTHIFVRDASGNLSPINWGTEPTNAITPALFAANSITDSTKRIVLVGDSGALGSYRRGSDFYFTNIDLPSWGVLEIQNGVETSASPPAGVSALNGPVRIWLGPEGGSGSAINLTQGTILTHYADNAATTDRHGFHIYNASAKRLNIGGSAFTARSVSGITGLFGGIYAYNLGSSGTNYGEVWITGDLNAAGGIVAWDTRHSAGTLTIRGRSAADINTNGDLYVLFYRLREAWGEAGRFSSSSGSM